MAVTIGVDARAAAEVPAGRGRYVRELLGRLGGDTVLYARTATDAPGRWSEIAARDPLWHLIAARRASRECDVFLSTNSYLTAWFTTIPTAVVVYDLIPFVEGAQAQARSTWIERATAGPAMRRAGAFICISEATRRDLVARWPATAARAHAIPLAADERFAQPVEPARLDRPYVLAVGTLEPRKNLVTLIEAWAALDPAVRGDHVLALVGPQGWEMEATLGAAAAHPDSVRLLGYVSDAELHALYAGCSCFAYPSLYEGFGLPPLEAMAAGAPVVTSNVSSLPEVCGDAALLVDPRDQRALRDAIGAVLGDPALAETLRAAGRERAAGFSWDRTASETLAVLRQLAGDSAS